MSSNDYMTAGAASGALAGMLVVLALTAAGAIQARFLEWFLIVIIGFLVVGGIGGVIMEIFHKRGG